ncbi:MAG: polysaccharide biosynthesis protein [Firmicutes bacterium]|nr:polysaccharide biosynthesis protein [Bacillota bacterium]
MIKSQSRITGVIISYISTAIRALSKLLITPIYIRILGLDDYGFYQYIFSIASYVMILDFGISSVINSFSIKCREKGDNDGVENVMFYTLVFSCVAALVIVVFGIAIFAGAPIIFGDTINGRVGLTRKLLVLMISELIMLMFQHYFEGVILAAEKYITLRGIDLIQILFRCIITILLLYSNIGVMSIAIGDFLGVGICLGFEVFYCFNKIDLKIKYHYKDRELLRGIAKLAIALCLQSIISFLNSSIDKYVLGRYLGTVAVTIYSVALTFSIFFDEISTAIQRLYLPQVIKLVASGADGKTLTDFVIVPGRYQMVLCGGALGGFIVLGRQFIELWTGKETLDAWVIALFLMVPSVLPLIQNVCLSILTALNKRMFRSCVLGSMAIANLFVTIFLVKKIGLMGAPIGTCISLILGNNIAMNLYYKKVIGIDVIRLFKCVLKGILPCAVVATVVTYPLTLVKAHGLIWFAADGIVFCIVYFVLLWFFGFNSVEKNKIQERVLLLLRKMGGK